MKYPYYKTVIYDNFYEMIKGWHDNNSNKVAIKYIKNNKVINITYNNLIEQICSLHNYYKLHNIKDQNIGILAENRYEYITVYLSSAFFNVIVPLDKELDSDSLKNSLKDFDIKVLFYTNKTNSKIIDIVKNLNIKLINIDKEYENIIEKQYPVEKFFEDVSKVKKDKFSVLASTSGTDGKMKGVMLSQYNVVVNVRGTLENNILKNPTLSLLPMNHTYGFNPGVLATLYNGTTVCLNQDLKNIVRDLKKFNPFFFEAVPMIIEGMYNNIIREAKRKKKYKMLCCMIKISNFLLKHHIDVRHIFFGNIINKRLRLVVSGGAALNPMYVEKFGELGIKILNGYGLTECSPTIAVSREFNNVIGSAGTIMNHIKVKIASDGEILVKGPNVMLGYYNNLKATKESMIDGYFKTGDLGYVKDRVIFVTGRKKNLIILGNGKNFSPEFIENKLLNIPYIKECIVTTKKVKNNDIIIAKIYMENPSDKLNEDIKKINNSLPKYMKIDEIEIMEQEFEKNSSKKIRRNNYVK